MVLNCHFLNLNQGLAVLFQMLFGLNPDISNVHKTT